MIPGEENLYFNPVQNSCLGNSKDRGAWWATVPGVTRSWTQLSNFHFPYFKNRLKINYLRTKSSKNSDVTTKKIKGIVR